MSFLTPLYLFGAALIALPVILHLLRRDVAPSVPFTAVSLLTRTPVDRARSRRLRDVLLLAARVAALLLLAASFARPYRAAAPAASRLTVVAVDRSFSMASAARLARARELARQAIDEAASDRVVVVAFDDRADVLSASGAPADARAAVKQIEAGYGSTRYAAALDKAAELLLDETHGRVVVISDLQRSGFDQTGAVLPEGIDLVVRDTGSANGNLSVSNVAIDRRQVTVTLRNDGAQPLTSDLMVTADQRQLPARAVTIPANGTADAVFEAGADVARATAMLMNDFAGGFAADNERFAVRVTRSLPHLLVVSGSPGSTDGFYLTRALLAEGDEGADFEVAAVSGQAFSAMPAARLRDESAIAILSTHGLERRAGEALRAYLQGGGGLLVAASPDVDPVVLTTVLGWTPALAPKEVTHVGVLAATDLRHPVLRRFDAVAANFGQLRFDRAWQVDTSTGWRVLARYTSGDAALAERLGGAGRVLLFTSDFDRRWNDFPLHPAFVPFVQEAMHYLGARAPLVSGYFVSDVPRGVPARPGFIERDGRPAAVNVDPRESRVDRVTPEEFRSLVTRTASPAGPRAARLAAQAEAQQNYWRYGLMLMLATLVVEAFVGAR